MGSLFIAFYCIFNVTKNKIQMTCKCRNQPTNVPQNAEWGPAFWKLIHALAEKAGSAPLPGLQGDETRAWKIILTTLPNALACEDCRIHLTAYITTNPINIPDKYSDLREYVRTYLYLLHEDVNKRLNKKPFGKVDLGSLYGKVNLRQAFDVTNVIVHRSILATAVPILSWNNWSSQVRTLLGMYS
jgi:hypothetical protein